MRSLSLGGQCCAPRPRHQCHPKPSAQRRVYGAGVAFQGRMGDLNPLLGAGDMAQVCLGREISCAPGTLA